MIGAGARGLGPLRAALEWDPVQVTTLQLVIDRVGRENGLGFRPSLTRLVWACVMYVHSDLLNRTRKSEYSDRANEVLGTEKL